MPCNRVLQNVKCLASVLHPAHMQSATIRFGEIKWGSCAQRTTHRTAALSAHEVMDLPAANRSRTASKSARESVEQAWARYALWEAM